MSTSTFPELEFVVRTIAQTAVDREREFGDLDAVAGDGDLGYSLARGFENVLAEWDGFDRSAPSVFLQKVALVISKRVGGTSGPLWGTAFLRASSAVKGKDELTGEDVVAMLRGAVEGIMTRGKSDVGDKTLLDALVPLTDTVEASVSGSASAADVAKEAAAVARTSADATAELQAKRGRASYTGERSIGSPDAGAVVIAIMAETVAENWPS